MAELVLLGVPESTYTWSARLALVEKGVPYEMKLAAPRTPEILALHPFGKIPAMRHGDVVLFECQAIMRYVDEAFPGPSLTPPDIVGRARMAQWMSAVGDYFYQAMVIRLTLERFAPLLFKRKADEAVIANTLPDVTFQLDLLDRLFKDSKYLAGDGLSLADLLLIPAVFYVAMTPEGDSFMEQRPHLSRWQKSMAARRSFITTMPGFATKVLAEGVSPV